MVRFLIVINTSWLVLLAAGGCATTQVVESYPSPNFNGPSVTQNAPPVYLPQSRANNPKFNIAPRSSTPREWIPVVRTNSWKYIVIHHSATPSGGAAKFGREHKQKGWDELGYHFVIGNGTDTGNGAIEVGSRWPKQKWGAHAKTPDNRYNDFGIGICLVGNFDVERPTAQQLKSLERLIVHLTRTYNIPANNIIGHGQTKATDCPGRFLSVAAIRRDVSRMLADGWTDNGGMETASTKQP